MVPPLFLISWKLIRKYSKEIMSRNQLKQVNQIYIDSCLRPMNRNKMDHHLMALLVLNIFFYGLHIHANCQDIYYFFQLTIISQNLVILNFILSISMHERKSAHSTRKMLSRLHLVTLSLEAIVVIGFWGLRVFFSKGIIDPNQKRSLYVETLSTWVHGGAFSTMFYFIKTDQLVHQKSKKNKYIMHLLWGLPFVFIQYLHWYLTGEHVYGFLKYFEWPQLIVFEVGLYYLAVAIDYSLTLRHGLRLTVNMLKRSHTTIEDIELAKEREEELAYLAEQERKRQLGIRRRNKSK